MRRLLALLTLALNLSAFASTVSIDPKWLEPIAPFQIADNLYYVGSQDLAVYLVTTPAGNILIDANLETSPPQIKASIEKLGFRYADTKILLNGQAHYDHMAGAAQVLRETHARNEVMDGDVAVVESGGKSDFLAASGSLLTYPPAKVDRVLHDGDTVMLGGVTITAHKTAGHTRGCTSFTMRVHIPGEPAGTLRNVVIVGGISFWSDFHFVATAGQPESYPGIAADFTHTFAVLHALPCDVFLGMHGQYFGMLGKLPRYASEGPKIFIDPAGYRTFVDKGQATFEAELAKQKAAAAAGL